MSLEKAKEYLNSAVRLTVEELEKCSGSLGFVDVCKKAEV